MKLLAIRLNTEQGNLQIRYKFVDIAKETSTAYRIEKSHELLNNRTMVKKDEVDKIMYGNERRDCNTCEFDHVSLHAWVLVEQSEPDYELLRCWRKFLKDKAVEQLRERNKALKALYAQVVNL